MSCGCTKKIKEKELMNHKKDSVKKRAKKIRNNEDLVSYSKRLVGTRIETILYCLEEILPILEITSEEDLLCLECCEKHLAKAHGFFDESATKEYRVNVFYTIGQLGLAENHARKHEPLQEAIRRERLSLQRDGKEPNWGSLLDLLYKYKNEDV